MGFKGLRNIIYNLTPKRVQDFYQAPLIKQWSEIDPYLCHSYSQEGEDLILNRIFEGKREGFYIDVGAHHPKRFSNTYLFYKMGWRGINIDAMPGSMASFDHHRPEDINLEFGISDIEQEADYFVFNEPALNTFSERQAQLKNGYKNFKIERTIRVKLIPFSQILDKHVSEDQEIDFLNIDVEAFDFHVLNSIDFNRIKPKIILIEESDFNFESMEKSRINNHLQKNGYVLMAKTFNTLIYTVKQ